MKITKYEAALRNNQIYYVLFRLLQLRHILRGDLIYDIDYHSQSLQILKYTMRSNNWTIMT